ncbi:hypothetical protein EVJ50_03995 [Synechococcus sp. RSCCF101]|nr:hypothetical protein EVJ50_03995 [Synechococcus sp. RSCCF101]
MSTNQSLKLLTLFTLQFVTPFGVSLIWALRCAPLHLHSRRPTGPASSVRGHDVLAWPGWVATAVLASLLLLPWFQGGAILGGLLMAPRSGQGLQSELYEIIRLSRPGLVLQCFGQAAVFTATCYLILQRKLAAITRSAGHVALQLADALTECLMALLILQAILLLVLPPFSGSRA